MQQQQQQQDAAAVGSNGTGGLQLYDQEAQPRWEPWGLQQAAAAAAAATAAAGGTSGSSGLDAAELQAWRQGALGLWRKPHLSVKVQLLPLEQQQDPAWLEQLAAAAARGVVNDLAALLEGRDSVGRGDAAQEEEQQQQRSSSFGDSPNLLLLGRILEEEGKEEAEVVGDDDEEG
jgi:hypothetical protein